MDFTCTCSYSTTFIHVLYMCIVSNGSSDLHMNVHVISTCTHACTVQSIFTFWFFSCLVVSYNMIQLPFLYHAQRVTPSVFHQEVTRLFGRGTGLWVWIGTSLLGTMETLKNKNGTGETCQSMCNKLIRLSRNDCLFAFILSSANYHCTSTPCVRSA